MGQIHTGVCSGIKKESTKKGGLFDHLLSPSKEYSSGGDDDNDGHGNEDDDNHKKKPIALFLNCTRLDYDRKLNFEKLSSITDFRRNDVDAITCSTNPYHDDDEDDNDNDKNKEEMIVKEIVRLVNDVHRGTEIVIVKEMTLPSKAIQQFSKSVKLICEAGTGYNNIPLDICRSKHIQVCNIPTYSTDAVAHTAIAFMMNFASNMFRQQHMLSKNNRANFTGPFTLPLMELNGKTLGLIGGSGRIGTKVAEIAVVLGMNIIISTRRRSTSTSNSNSIGNDDDTDDSTDNNDGDDVDDNTNTNTDTNIADADADADTNANNSDDDHQHHHHHHAASLPLSHKLYNHPKIVITYDVKELLNNSDFVSLHTPLIPGDTENWFGTEQLSQMKDTAYFINTSRGKLVNETELLDGLEHQVIAGAGLDVTHTEPPAMDSKLWSLPNVAVSPHIGWRRFETRQRLVDMTGDNITSYIQDHNNCINVVS